MLGLDFDRFAELALSAPAAANGLVWVPYFDGERSPNLPTARGALQGVTTTNLTPANVARAAVEGLLCSMAYCIEKITEQGVDVEHVLLVGGGAHSVAVRRLAPAVLGRPVDVPKPGEYVARGAARQAAWLLSGADEPPRWRIEASETFTAQHTPEVLDQYREARGLTLGQSSRVVLV
jgi:xylulokinase